MIKWMDQYVLGVPEIDEQHKEFFNLLNALKVAGEEEVMEVLSSVENYAKFHFETEEKLMEETNYRGLSAHQVSHKIFKDQLNNYKDMVANDIDELRNTLFDFMSDWIIRHILIVDFKYRSHLYKNGFCTDGKKK